MSQAVPSSTPATVMHRTTVTDASIILACHQMEVQRGDFVLCAGVDLTLYAGDICHLLGDNGAGKTTFMMQLAGLLPVSSETFTSTASRPVYVSHQLGIYPELTVAQNLRFLLNLYGIEPTWAELQMALAWVGLAGYEAVSCRQLSAGQMRRVTLARLALMTPEHSPLWLLDEPLTALDVAMVATLQARLVAFAQAGGAILLTSHQKVTIANKSLDLNAYSPAWYDGDPLGLTHE